LKLKSAKFYSVVDILSSLGTTRLGYVTDVKKAGFMKQLQWTDLGRVVKWMFGQLSRVVQQLQCTGKFSNFITDWLCLTVVWYS